MKHTHRKEVWALSQLYPCFRALSNPIRLKVFLTILEEACNCDVDANELQGNCVTAIAERLHLSQPTVSNHIKELIATGLVYTQKKNRKVFLFGSSEAAEQFQNFGLFFVDEVNQDSCPDKKHA